MGSGTPILLRTTVGPKWPGVRSPTSSNSTHHFPTQPTAVSSPPLLYLSSCIPHLFRLLLTFCTLTFILAQVHHACSERQGNMTFDVAHFCINQINFSKEEKIPTSRQCKSNSCSQNKRNSGCNLDNIRGAICVIKNHESIHDMQQLDNGGSTEWRLASSSNHLSK